jgi:hypothetical protein
MGSSPASTRVGRRRPWKLPHVLKEAGEMSIGGHQHARTKSDGIENRRILGEHRSTNPRKLSSSPVVACGSDFERHTRRKPIVLPWAIGAPLNSMKRSSPPMVRCCEKVIAVERSRWRLSPHWSDPVRSRNPARSKKFAPQESLSRH